MKNPSKQLGPSFKNFDKNYAKLESSSD